jgi:hypothetical protein
VCYGNGTASIQADHLTFLEICPFLEKDPNRPLTQRLSLSFSRSDVYSFTYLQLIAALTLRSYFAFSRSRVAMPIVAANPGIKF